MFLMSFLFFFICFFFFNDTATTEIYTLSLHDALPGSRRRGTGQSLTRRGTGTRGACPDRGGGSVKTILVAGAVSLLLALLGTPLAIKVFSRRGYGQLIREEGPRTHVTKRGTPTMGGTVIVIASVVGYFVGNV